MNFEYTCRFCKQSFSEPIEVEPIIVIHPDGNVEYHINFNKFCKHECPASQV